MSEWQSIIETRLKTSFPVAATIKVTIVDAASKKFAVKVISDQFKGKTPLQRHRMVNKAVGLVSAPETEEEKETSEAVHALEIEAEAEA